MRSLWNFERYRNRLFKAAKLGALAFLLMNLFSQCSILPALPVLMRASCKELSTTTDGEQTWTRRFFPQNSREDLWEFLSWWFRMARPDLFKEPKYTFGPFAIYRIGLARYRHTWWHFPSIIQVFGREYFVSFHGGMLPIGKIIEPSAYELHTRRPHEIATANFAIAFTVDMARVCRKHSGDWRNPMIEALPLSVRVDHREAMWGLRIPLPVTTYYRVEAQCRDVELALAFWRLLYRSGVGTDEGCRLAQGLGGAP